VWLIALLIVGGVSVLLGLQEAAALTVLTGLFVAAQAADLDPRLRPLYLVVSWIVPVTGAATFAGLTWMLLHSDATGWLRVALAGVAILGALAALLSMLRPCSDALSLRLFRGDPPSHSSRLAARLVMLGLLLAFPAWYALSDVTADLLAGPDSPLRKELLGSSLVGYVLLALAAVGFLVRRDLRTTLDRLGLRPLSGTDLAVAALGVVGLAVVNGGLELAQKALFPELWQSDQRISQAIASQLGPAQILLLGLSAGIGEEITLRGALQPRLGIVVTSLLFAALHVQYSWFGMMVILVLGLILGIIRKRTSTTVAMVVHAVYDVLAVFAT